MTTPRSHWVGRAAALAAAAAVGLVAACASPGTPPGGPPDKVAPVIVKVTPDSNATNVKAKSFTVAFSEVVSERPRTGADLGAVVLLSPSDGPARVSWNRDAITVRPRKGFHPNTAYAVTILPGLSDLRGNATKAAHTFVFSTGATIPHALMRGAVFDWTTNKPVPLASIEAMTGGDTTFKWITRTDSAGRYTLPYLPPGPYLLRTLVDANGNGKLDPRELWDSVSVRVADSVRTDLYAFAHDTLGARIVGVDVKDSVTLRLTFDRALANDPLLRLDQVELRRADSTRVKLRVVIRAAGFDSLTRIREAARRDSAARADTSAAGRRALARADSLKGVARLDSIERARVEARRAARDTVVRIPPPVPARDVLATDFILQLDEPIPPGAYRVTVRDAVSVSRVTRSSERTFSRSKPVEKKPDDVKAAPGAKPGTPVKPDSTARPAAKSDSTAKPAPKPASPASPAAAPLTAPIKPSPDQP